MSAAEYRCPTLSTASDPLSPPSPQLSVLSAARHPAGQTGVSSHRYVGQRVPNSPGAVGLRVVEPDGQRPVVVVLAHREARLRRVNGAAVDDVRRTGRGEVALVGEVRALAIAHLLDQFRDQEIDVGVALAVRMRGHIDRDAVHARREVGAVVEIEGTQEVLVRLAVAAVLRDDQARNHLERRGRGNAGGGRGKGQRQRRQQAAEQGRRTVPECRRSPSVCPIRRDRILNAE